MAKHANMQLSIAALQPPVDQVEYRRVFEQIVRFADILFVNKGPHNWANRRLIVELTGNIPAMYVEGIRRSRWIDSIPRRARDLIPIHGWTGGRHLQWNEGRRNPCLPGKDF